MTTLSGVGLTAVLFSVLSLAWSATSMPVWAEPLEREWLNMSGLPVAIGILQFSFTVHACVPTIYRNMQEPSKFTFAVVFAYTIAGAFYLAVGSGSYFVYASQAQPSFMQNLGRDLNFCKLPHMDFVSACTAACFFVSVQSTFPLISATLIEA